MEMLGSLGAVSIFVLLILLVFSISSWGIIIYKWRTFKATDHEEEQFLLAFERSHINPKDFEHLKNVGTALPLSPSGAVYIGVANKVDHQAGLFRGGDILEGNRGRRWPDRKYLEKVIHYIVQGKINQQESYLPFLATTGNITPFIGLFGTVVGVINAFGEIGEQGSASIAAVAPGVSEALVATAAGLFAAIPAVVAYNYFLTRIRKNTYRMEAFSIEFLNALDELASEVHEAEVLR